MKRINVSDIGDFAASQYSKVLKFAVFSLDQRLKIQSPVDQGGFRQNWQVGQNLKTAPIIPPPYEKSKGKIPKLKKLNYQEEKSGNVYTLINPLPYAEAVCYGTNTPPSWGGSFKSRQGLSAGWPNVEVARVVKDIKKFKPKE